MPRPHHSWQQITSIQDGGAASGIRLFTSWVHDGLLCLPHGYFIQQGKMTGSCLILQAWSKFFIWFYHAYNPIEQLHGIHGCNFFPHFHWVIDGCQRKVYLSEATWRLQTSCPWMYSLPLCQPLQRHGSYLPHHHLSTLVWLWLCTF